MFRISKNYGVILSLFCSFITISSCKSISERSEVDSIFGKDDRVEADSVSHKLVSEVLKSAVMLVDKSRLISKGN